MRNKERILEMLTQADGFISGEIISNELAISRTAIWKNIHALIDEGYKIECVQNRGYRLLSLPEPVADTIVAPSLHTRALGRNIRFYNTVDSTNTEAKRRALDGDPHGTVYMAEAQVAGRGRLGRKWTSPPGSGLWFTLLLRPECTPSQAAGMTWVAGLAVCTAIRDICHVDAGIKWPNDIVVNGKKLCGILTETSGETNHVEYVVVGVGINVSATVFPEEIAHKATSLVLSSHRTPPRRGMLLASILNLLEPMLDDYLNGRTTQLLQNYRDMCVTLGRPVSLKRGETELTGLAVGLTPDGELIVRTDDGKEEIIFSGEVSVQGVYSEHV